MQNELEIKAVPFLGTELMAARDQDGQIWAGVRWMCDGIGLTKGQMQNERVRIHADKVLSQGERNLVLPTKGGNQETLCLALDFVPLWLAKISITPTMEAETPELAANLEQYQLRAKDVLAAAFLPEQARQKPMTAMEMLRKQYEAMFELGDRVEVLEEKVDRQMTIDHSQQRQLQSRIGKRVYERAAETFPAKEVKAHTQPYFQAIYRDLKDRFGVGSYRDIRPADYQSAQDYVGAWIEPAELRRLTAARDAS